MMDNLQAPLRKHFSWLVPGLLLTQASWADNWSINTAAGQPIRTTTTTTKVGIGLTGSTSPASLLDVEGGVSIGAAYSGTTAAPSNGMIVEGNVGIGTNAPGTYRLNVSGTTRLGGVVDVTGVVNSSADLVFSGTTAVIRSNSADASDNKRLVFGGGGGTDPTRGGHLSLYGNEFSGAAGDAQVIAGLNGAVRLKYGASSTDGLVVASTGAVSVPGTLAVTGAQTNSADIVFSGTTGLLRSNTSAGTDNKRLVLSGGGSLSSARGANVHVYGNNMAADGGAVFLEAGNVATGKISFNSGGLERMILSSAGTVGIGTSSPDATSKLDVNGKAIFRGPVVFSNGGLEFANGQNILWRNSGGTIRNGIGLAADNHLEVGGTVDGGVRFYTGTGNLSGSVDAAGNWSFARGSISVSKNLTVGNNELTDRFLNLDAPAGQYRSFRFLSAGSTRWQLRVSNGDEAGNANANLELVAHDNSGNVIDFPMKIVRAANQPLTLSRPLKLATSSSISPQIDLIGSSGTNPGLFLTRGSSTRWGLISEFGAEGGSNSGSDLSIRAYNDAGATYDVPMSIERAPGGMVNISRPVTISGTLNAAGGFNTMSNSPSSTVGLSVTNSDNTSGTSHARLHATVGGANGGDAFTRYTVNGVSNWSAGLDNSDDDAFVITPATFPGGTTNGIRISQGGTVSIPGKVEAGKGLTAVASSDAPGGGISLKGSDNVATIFDAYGASGNGERFGILDLKHSANPGLKLRLNANGASYLNGGGVGIGIEIPAANLHIANNFGAANGDGLILDGQNSSGHGLSLAYRARLVVNGTEQPSTVARIVGERDLSLTTGAPDAGSLKFFTRDMSGGMLLGMSINRLGQVGINTTEMGAPLDVVGAARIRGPGMNDFTALRLRASSSTNDIVRLSFTGDGDGEYAQIVGQVTAEVEGGNRAGAGKLVFRTRSGGNGTLGNLADRMTITEDGRVGIGTEPASDANLHVAGAVRAGTILATKWKLSDVPDYVFEKEYKLSSLEKVEAFVRKNKHLPDIPSAREMKKEGLDLVQLNFDLLKKVEELTLYAIEQNRRSKDLEKEVLQLKRALESKTTAGKQVPHE